MATDTRIGTKIRRARERKRMSQSDLAEALGVSRSAVNAWENDRALPQSSVGAIEEVLGISIELPVTEEEKITALETQAAEMLAAARQMRAARQKKNAALRKDEDEEPERGAHRHAV